MDDAIQTSLCDEAALLGQACGLDRSRVDEFAQFARERGESLLETLVARGAVSESLLLSKLAAFLGMQFLKEELESIPPEVLSAVSPSLAVSHQAVPIRECQGQVLVAWRDPFDWHRWDEFRHLVGRPVQRVLCPRTIIERMIKAHYGVGAETVQRIVSTRQQDDAPLQQSATDLTDLSEEEAANEPTVVNLMNQVIADAIRERATDIHFEPRDGRYRIRYRVDGILETVPIPVRVNTLKNAVVSRIKVMSGLNITEKRLPQDGRATVLMDGQKLDLRVSILPGIFGEAVVIRIQNRQNVKLDLEALGFFEAQRRRIEDLCGRPYGLMLVTGPTGSGKTTTLYTCLQKIASPDIKVITIEDPVEYWMDELLQMQVNEDIGFTFACALRSVLRHDPDVMLIGEIRDRETADIAIRSALTGHLVFATLHTNDASGAATRLCDIGVEPYLVASSLQGVLAQRLVRRICPHCAQPAATGSLAELGQHLVKSGGQDWDGQLMEGRGCDQCRFTGYRGRMAIGEVLFISPELRQLIQDRSPADRIRDVARSQGMALLRESAVLAAQQGLTTVSEVIRITQEDL
jgi:general secretion pathway protein E/type IV pilus assembly protein PilB